MQTFVEHYRKEQINEFTWSQLGKGFLRIPKNIFGKRNVGVNVDLMTGWQNMDRSTYNFVQGALTSNFKNKNKKTKGAIKQIFIKDVYKGEIDDSAKKLGGFEKVKDQIKDISVYETNKGGKITTFFLEDETGNEKFFIGTSWVGDKNFKDLFGMWVTSLASRLNRITPSKQKKSLQAALDDPKSFLLQTPEEPTEPTEEPTELELPIETPKEDQEYGLKDILINDYEDLISQWGDGIKSDLIKGSSYPFRKKFERTPFKHRGTGYEGYKYSDGVHNVYLMDTGDGNNAFMLFGDRDSYDWAKDIGMLSFWKQSTGESEQTNWKQGTIEDME